MLPDDFVPALFMTIAATVVFFVVGAIAYEEGWNAGQRSAGTPAQTKLETIKAVLR